MHAHGVCMCMCASPSLPALGCRPQQRAPSVTPGTPSCVQAGAKALMGMCMKRNFTGASAAVHGHKDTFGKHVSDGLENKVTIGLGDGCGWEAGPKMWDLLAVGPLPPGALAYVRVKAATICRAGRDLEFHQLADAVHLAADASAWLKQAVPPGVEPPKPSPTRGVWGADGVFQPHGVALCDWWATQTNEARRAFLRSRGRPVQMGSNGIPRYFSSG